MASGAFMGGLYNCGVAISDLSDLAYTPDTCMEGLKCVCGVKMHLLYNTLLHLHDRTMPV